MRWYSPTLCVRYCRICVPYWICPLCARILVMILLPPCHRIWPRPHSHMNPSICKGNHFAHSPIVYPGQPRADSSLGRTEASSVLRTVACQINQCVNTSFCAVSFLWFSMIFRLLSGRRTPASCALPLFPLTPLCSCCPVLGACLPIWLNRTWTMRLRVQLCRWHEAFCQWLGFLAQELWPPPQLYSPPPLCSCACFRTVLHDDETFRAMRSIRSRCKTAATGSISVAKRVVVVVVVVNVAAPSTAFPPPAFPRTLLLLHSCHCNRMRHIARWFLLFSASRLWNLNCLHFSEDLWQPR